MKKHESPEDRVARLERAGELIDKWSKENPEFDQRVLPQLRGVGDRGNDLLLPTREPYIAPDSVVAALRAADEAFGEPDPIFPEGDPRDAMVWDDLARLVLQQEAENAKLRNDHDSLSLFARGLTETISRLEAERDQLRRYVGFEDVKSDHPTAAALRAAMEHYRAEAERLGRSIKLQAEHINDLAVERNALRQAVADAEVVIDKMMFYARDYRCDVEGMAALERFRNRNNTQEAT